MGKQHLHITMPDEKPSRREIFRAVPYIFRICWRTDKVAVAYFALAAFITWPLTALSIVATKNFADNLFQFDARKAALWGGLIVGRLLVNGWLDRLRDFLESRFRLRLDFALRMQAIRMSRRLPYAALEDPNFRMLVDAYRDKQYVVFNMVDASLTIVDRTMALFGYATIFLFAPWQAVFLLLVVIVVQIVLGRYEAQWSWRLFSMETRQGRRANYLSMALTDPRALLDVRAWGVDRFFWRRWKQISQEIRQEKLRNSMKAALVEAAAVLLQAVATSVALAILIRGVSRHEITAGAVITFMTGYAALWGSLTGVLSRLRMVFRESPFLVVLHRYLSLSPDHDTGKAVPKGPVELCFDGVWFRYPGTETDVLKGVSFTIRDGGRTALVGLNGAGKSTLVKLLMGIYEPTHGRILMNGVPLSEYRSSSWRRALSVLNQDTFRGDDTIRELLLYGDYERAMASFDELRFHRALRTSGMDTVLESLDRGLDTHVGKHYAMPEDKASDLSGGQSRILTIARALFRQAAVYVLDEPTSSVDAVKEERFFGTLKDMLHGKAILFISHRLSTLRQAERIIVLSEGIVAEMGSHEELVAQDGIYAELYRLQAASYA